MIAFKIVDASGLPSMGGSAPARLESTKARHSCRQRWEESKRRQQPLHQPL